MNVRTKKRLNKWRDILRFIGWMNQSINEWMNQWMNESMNKWKNEWTNKVAVSVFESWEKKNCFCEHTDNEIIIL